MLCLGKLSKSLQSSAYKYSYEYEAKRIKKERNLIHYLEVTGSFGPYFEICMLQSFQKKWAIADSISSDNILSTFTVFMQTLVIW